MGHYMEPLTINYNGFTGTRKGMTEPQRAIFREALRWKMLFFPADGNFLFHGCCIGSDVEANDIAAELGYKTIGLPGPDGSSTRRECALWMQRPAKPFLERDRDIVDESHHIFATPAEMVMMPQGGTWYTIRYALKRKKNLTIILPDGSIENYVDGEAGYRKPQEGSDGQAV